jgi:hypothetical protein
MGLSVSYDDFIEKFMDHILPDHFGVDLDDDMRDRIMNVSKLYSKGRGDRAGMFRQDSSRKEDLASEEVKAAAQLFLSESFSVLKSYSSN